MGRFIFPMGSEKLPRLLNFLASKKLIFFDLKYSVQFSRNPSWVFFVFLKAEATVPCPF